MAASSTRGKRIGDVVKWEADGGDKGYCRELVQITVEADIGVGSCITSAGAWVDGSSSAGGDTAYILIDETIYDYDAGDTPTLVCLARGPAIVKKAALTFDGTGIAADYTAAAAALKALGILAE